MIFDKFKREWDRDPELVKMKRPSKSTVLRKLEKKKHNHRELTSSHGLGLRTEPKRGHGSLMCRFAADVIHFTELSALPPELYRWRE